MSQTIQNSQVTSSLAKLIVALRTLLKDVTLADVAVWYTSSTFDDSATDVIAHVFAVSKKKTHRKSHSSVCQPIFWPANESMFG